MGSLRTCSTKMIIVRSHFSVGWSLSWMTFVFSNRGVTKLLKGLNPSKALGPDELHPRVLKELATELGPVFAHPFQKSLDTGEIPKECLLQIYIPSIKRMTGLSHVIIIPSH